MHCSVVTLTADAAYPRQYCGSFLHEMSDLMKWSSNGTIWLSLHSLESRSEEVRQTDPVIVYSSYEEPDCFKEPRPCERKRDF